MPEEARPTNADYDDRLTRLMRADGGTFISVAYEMILGRSVDADGRNHYTGRLSAGVSRLDVIRELSESREGRDRLSRMDELADAVRRLTGQPATAPRSVHELLALPERQFVNQTFRILFGQSAIDPDLECAVMARLVRGTPRAAILAELVGGLGPCSVPTLDGLAEWIATNHGAPTRPADSVDALMAQFDSAFIECAYRSILGRAPDESGFLYYYGRLCEGHSRSSVIEQLAQSPEARGRGAQVRGLDRLLARYRWRRLPVLGRAVAALLGMESESRRARSRRMLESLLRQVNRLEMRMLLGSPNSGDASRAAAAERAAERDSLRSDLESALLARHDALIEIQRASFDGELLAIRRMLAELTRAQNEASPQSRARGSRMRGNDRRPGVAGTRRR